MEMQQLHRQKQQEKLKCPRCDSSNTKFCYYNNYSLSQPRHLCKACKRYWTRGGTLRNVPVGGGCRKSNKRIKRPTSSMTSEVSNCSQSSTSHPLVCQSRSNQVNSLFYGLPNISSLKLNGFSHLCSPRLSSLVLGFSSSSSKQMNILDHPILSSTNYGFDFSTLVASSSTLLDNQQHLTANYYQTLKIPFEHRDLLMNGNNHAHGHGVALKEVKADDNGFSSPSLKNSPQLDYLNPMNTIRASCDSGAWHDPSNLGFSLTSLI